MNGERKTLDEEEEEEKRKSPALKKRELKGDT
jgi:hypothetical protein